MIGVFDSGFGGLTVLRAFMDGLPAYDFIYLGDNARAPYGNKSLKVIYEYTRQAVEFLFQKGAGMIILGLQYGFSKGVEKNPAGMAARALS